MTGHLGKQIAPLVDGQLDHDDRDRALAHLARCRPCQWEVAELRRLKARLAALASPALPGEMADRLMQMAAVGGPRQVSAGVPTTSGAPSARPMRPVGRLIVQDVRPRRGMSVSMVVTGVGDMLRSGPTRDPQQARTPDRVQPIDLGGAPTVRVTLTMSVGPVRRAKSPGLSRPYRHRIRSRAVPRATMPWVDRRPPAGPATAVRGRHSRTRRTLVGSAAVLVFAVAGAALGGTRGSGTVPGPSTQPAVIPAVQPSLVSGLTIGRLEPVMAAVTLPTGARR
ncbi:zf-HC2 domain-containing protein [Frankia sp. Cppng1_Ct_nod]|uniref:anti-sigma factor family protein n=1 Tax=Frankia sp. Cppng1_Ct_nod TaxID=2897162 RepID=UPI0010418C0A|nr:zf-HC2 domain-containing protein [Frankia sp. Cppng1_Ct_nod]